MKAVISIFLFLIPSAMMYAQTASADDITGNWVATDNKVKVQIYKSGTRYYGKITWLKEPMKNGKPKTDHKNPDSKLRNNPIVGLIVLKDFVFNDGKWTSGEVYDPSSGNEYDCNITMPDKNTLRVRGYIGFSLFGKTVVWKRA